MVVAAAKDQSGFERLILDPHCAYQSCGSVSSHSADSVAQFCVLSPKGMVSVSTITHPFPSIFDERRFKIVDDAHAPQVGVRSSFDRATHSFRECERVDDCHMQVGVGLIGYDCFLSSLLLSLIVSSFGVANCESWTKHAYLTRIVLLIRMLLRARLALSGTPTPTAPSHRSTCHWNESVGRERLSFITMIQLWSCSE